MRPYILFVILACCNLYLNAQKNVQYNFKLTDVNTRTSGTRDTIVITDEASFKVNVEAAGLDLKTTHKVFYFHGEEKENVTATVNILDFSLKDRNAFYLEFHFCDQVTIDDEVKIRIATVRYSFDSTYKTAGGKDTIVQTEGVVEVVAGKEGESIVALNAVKKQIKEIGTPEERLMKQQKTVCKEERIVTIVFKKPTTEKTQEEKTFDALNERLTAILNQPLEAEPIGEIIMLKTDVSIKNEKGELKKSKAKRVEITFVNGAIGRRVLHVELEDGSIFFNKSAPVSLPKFNMRKADKLYRYDDRDPFNKQYIEMGDVLDYHYFGRFNYPADGSIVLTKEKERDTLTVGSSLNSLLDVSIYTDLLGLLGNKPNGLIQTEVAGNFISNSGNLKNADIVFHNFMRPYIRLSKYDSKFRSLDSLNIKAGPHGKDTVNRTYLNQISYFQAGILANVMRFGIGVNQLIYVNIGADINLVNTDSLYKSDVSFVNYYPEVNYTITRLRNFGMDCSLRLLSQHLTRSAPLENIKSIWIFKPQVTLYYYPSKDQSNKIYLRFNYFNNLNDRNYNFTQFQLGFKTNLKLNTK